MSLFECNAQNARLHNFIPKHGKADDAPRSAELQFRNVHILPSSAAAVLLAENGGTEVEAALFVGDPPTQRFFGIDEIASGAKFKNRHQLEIDGLESTLRCTLIDKIKVRAEGGPQRLLWADFSVHIEDPSAEEIDFFHEHMNRDVDLTLLQDADLVEQMRAEAQGMAVKTVANGELDLDGEQRDADAIDAVAKHLESNTAEVPLRGAKRKPAKKVAKKPAKKAGKRGAKKAA